MNLKILSKEEWLYWWRQLPACCREVYWHPAYYDTASRWEKGHAECIYIDKGDAWMIYPYLRHPIVGYQLPGAAFYYDIQTAYGYGGALFIGEWDDKDKITAYTVIADYFRETNAVAELVRCHTEWIDPAVMVKAGYSTIKVRTNVETELIGKLPEEILSSWEKEVQRNIRKAKEADLDHMLIHGTGRVNDFAVLYNMAAERLHMTPYYQFNEAYFRSLMAVDNKQVGQVLCSMSSSHSGLIASHVVFLGEKLAFLHLAAVDSAFRSVHADAFMMWADVYYASMMGCERICWGGGMSINPDDSLFKFKAKFGQRYVPVYIGCRIIDKKIYEQLCAEWNRRNAQKLHTTNKFLRYRY
ncbi:MAG: family N-acetyltransferase [Firmicutes bacterium]|nr:family N-acetyltransferase [Bacillota bacterium]